MTLEKLQELREELSFQLIEADGYEYEELLEKLESIEEQIEHFENYGYMLDGNYDGDEYE